MSDGPSDGYRQQESLEEQAEKKRLQPKVDKIAALGAKVAQLRNTLAELRQQRLEVERELEVCYEELRHYARRE